MKKQRPYRVVLVSMLCVFAMLFTYSSAQEETPSPEPNVETPPLPEATTDVDMDGNTDVMFGEEATVDAIADNPEDYYGRTVTVQEELVQALSPHIVVLEQNALLSSDRILVMFNEDTIDGFTVLELAENDVNVMVTGTVQTFVSTDIYNNHMANVDRDLFDEVFNGYENTPIIMADSVTVVEDIDVDDLVEPDLHDILNDPLVFAEMEVSIQEQLVAVVAPGVYRVEDKDFFNPVDVIVILPQSDGMIDGFSVEQLAEDDVEVLVTGMVHDFNLAELESQYGFDLVDEDYADYNEPVIVANSITIVDDDYTPSTE